MKSGTADLTARNKPAAQPAVACAEWLHIMDHDELVEEAKQAINKVFGDTSVSRAEAKASLKDIIGDIEVILDTMNDV